MNNSNPPLADSPRSSTIEIDRLRMATEDVAASMLRLRRLVCEGDPELAVEFENLTLPLYSGLDFLRDMSER